MNSLIIEIFTKLLKQMEAEKLNAKIENNIKEIDQHNFRYKATKIALNAIKKLDFEIKDVADIKGIPGIGPGTIRRIKEILETGKLEELSSKYDDAKQKK